MKFLHTRLKVRDLERAVAFYTTHLGCKESRRTVSGRGTQIAFLELPGVGAFLELSYLPWDPDFRLDEDIMHLAFEVTGMEATVERLRAAGVKITEEPERSKSGTWMAFIEDPDGYEIELLEHFT
ncbi:MAG: VOC family protein [Candidatus Sericytochromatia bacterium]|nr:VOC family protein [Candidatus Tanganyikabacteria bacterium]